MGLAWGSLGCCGGSWCGVEPRNVAHQRINRECRLDAVLVALGQRSTQRQGEHHMNSVCAPI
jgi:hypothetical protein